MSIKIMNHVWEHADAKGTDLLMLLALADAANNEGTCFPKIETLAKKVRCKKRNAQTILRKLEKNGDITITPQPNTSNSYTVVIDPNEKARLQAQWASQQEWTIPDTDMPWEVYPCYEVIEVLRDAMECTPKTAIQPNDEGCKGMQGGGARECISRGATGCI